MKHILIPIMVVILGYMIAANLEGYSKSMAYEPALLVVNQVK